MYRKLRQYLPFVLVCVLLALAVTPATAQDDPADVVTSFYNWYIDYTGYDETIEEFRNPLVDGSYKEREELSANLIDRVVTIRETEGGYHYDPFICAQDVPESFEIEMIDHLTEYDAAALVSTYFAWNPQPYRFVVALAEVDGAWQIENVICQESITPRGVTQSFYNWYLNQLRQGEGAPRHSEMESGYPFLTGDLNARIAEAWEQREPGFGDPVLCAQDVPISTAVNEVQVGQDEATMLVREYFAGNPDPKTLTVTLVKAGEQWQIDNIACAVAPETVAELLYNEFLRYMRYDMDRGIDRTPIADWAPYPWAQYMGQDVLDELLATYRSDEAVPADPFLCAQDLPAWVSAERVTTDADASATLQIMGAYAAGPDSYTTYALATVEMTVAPNGDWQLMALTCAR